MLIKIDHGQALAIKLYSMLPVLMLDERTMSTITWLNGPKHSKQKLGTLRQHIQIQQWDRYKPEACTLVTYIL